MQRDSGCRRYRSQGMLRSISHMRTARTLLAAAVISTSFSVSPALAQKAVAGPWLDGPLAVAAGPGGEGAARRSVQIFVTGYATPDEEDRATTGEPMLERSSGSGVIVDADGYIVTNAHVVENATRIEVELPFEATGGAPGRSILKRRGRTVGAQVVAIDHETDIAVDQGGGARIAGARRSATPTRCGPGRSCSRSAARSGSSRR